MQISVYGGSDATSVDQVVDRVRAAAGDGFTSIWFPQTMSFDALTALAVAAHAVPDIRLGTAVVPIQGRHPIPLAQQALTLADVAGANRVTLGVGVTHKPVSEAWYGIPYSTVVGLCAEELEALSGLLSPARAASVHGTYLTARITLAVKAPQPGLVLAALGPKMLALAGRFTDGTVTWMTGAGTLGRDVVPVLREAAADAERPDPRVIVGLPVCVTSDLHGARERVGAGMKGAAQLPSYRRMIAAEGVPEPVDIALVGDEAAVTAHIEALAAAGATELLANVVGLPDEVAHTRQFLASFS
ncbi:MAG TPA: TIGR03564 family F420-dependent LLM class oxidoreductase [Acidimicrobiales bacterium]|jgi:F420-dependent oxidoreductase-like protein|nr:TIGR03564 family F420-dependent LLM class oxidoreductase [Acidimicrobiales bacterium]